MEQALKLIEIGVTLLLGIAGLYLANSYRRQVKQKTTDGRIGAYSRLWEITEVATPMREKSWHVGKPRGPLTLDERKELYKDLTDWYYQNGNGMFLGDSTRRIYLNAKHNLICPDDELRPAGLSSAIKVDDEDQRSKRRGDLSTRQLSLLRTRMRLDLEVYGATFFGTLTREDQIFLEHCGEDWRKKPWSGALAKRGPMGVE
jgi:hypothetical protein